MRRWLPPARRVLQRFGLKARFGILLFCTATPPSIAALYFLEEGNPSRATFILTMHIVAMLAACGPLAGLCASLLLLGDLREVNEFCTEIKRGNYNVRIRLPVEDEDEHDIVRLKRNLNWMAHLIESRESGLRLRIQETDWQRQEFETLSYRDALTGLANRRQFEKRLHDLALQPSRRRGLLHLMLIDCDKFKRVNDTRGHQAGDALLGLLGQVIRSAVREEDDLPFRLGGDEFGVLFVCPDTQAALAIGERIRTIFKESNGYGCTLSIGLAPFEPTGGHPAELQEIMAQADAALYTAKRAGGDRIAIELPAAECGTPLIPGQAPPNAA